VNLLLKQFNEMQRMMSQMGLGRVLQKKKAKANKKKKRR
jgi:signal recognition particle GTPase